MVSDRQVKSISSEQTFSTDISLEEVARFLEDASRHLWEEVTKKKRVGRTVTVKLRTADFRTATRRMTPTQTPKSAAELTEIARELSGKFAFEPTARYRLAGVGLSNFEDETAEVDQRDLFSNSE